MKTLFASVVIALLVAVACAAPPAPTPTAQPQSPKPTTPAAAPAATAQPTAPAAAPTAAPQAQAQPPKVQAKLTIASPSKSLNFLPLFLSEPFLKQEGITPEVVVVEGGARAVAALTGGSAQFAGIDVAQILNVRAQGQDIVALAPILYGEGIQVVVLKDVLEKKGVNDNSPYAARIGALRGMKIAVTTPGSSTDLAIRTIFAQAKINPETEATIVFLNNPTAMLAALKQKQIDGFVHAAPATAEAVTSYGAVTVVDLLDTPATKDAVFYVIAARRDWAAANEATVVAALRGYWKTQQFIANDRVKAEEDAFKIYSPVDRQLFKVGWERWHSHWAKDPILKTDSIEKLVDYLKVSSPDKVPNIPVQQLMVNTYSEKAKP